MSGLCQGAELQGALVPCRRSHEQGSEGGAQPAEVGPGSPVLGMPSPGGAPGFHPRVMLTEGRRSELLHRPLSYQDQP